MAEYALTHSVHGNRNAVERAVSSNDPYATADGYKLLQTRNLIKFLFSCKTQDQVNKVVQSAVRATKIYQEQFNLFDVDFHARIRNAERQVRERIVTRSMGNINPEETAITLIGTHQERESVDRWGRLADLLLKGYKLG